MMSGKRTGAKKMQKKSLPRDERAKPSRMQVFRMARIVALLKKNRMPSAEMLLKEYEKLEYEENQLIRAKYSLRTVYRDIDSLKNDFHCPIAYDRAAKGYYLTDHSWEFNCPAQLSESAMLALVIGARIAEDVFPEPVRSRIAAAVDEILKGNNPDFLDTTLVHSLKVFAESGAVDVSTVFPVVFEAWQKHRMLRIVYDDMKGDEPTVRVVEPHVLFLYMREWRIKAYCHYRKEPRTFVISRIRRAELLDDTFAPDKGIIRSVTLDTIVSWRKYENVKIRITGEVRKYAVANRMHTKQRIKKDGKGSWLFILPEVSEQLIVPWILSQRGEAVPLEPPEIVAAVKSAAAELLEKLS
jgi:predicted DNA-binding transcriptional regulator YafY